MIIDGRIRSIVINDSPPVDDCGRIVPSRDKYKPLGGSDRRMTGLYIHTFLTLIGSVSVAEDGSGRITALYLPNQNLEPMDENETSVLSEAAAQVNEYLSGRRRAFDLPLSIEGTDFFTDVLDAVNDIPYGEIRTYAEVADMAGHPNAYRAVGTACAKNPLPLIIPCHRVVPSSGGIGSYAGGSSLKRRLLELENPDISL